MKGFAKVFLLGTLLFAVSHLSACVNQIKKDIHPPGYSLSVEQTPVFDLQNVFVFTVSKVPNSTGLKFGNYKAEVIKPVITEPVVQLQMFRRKAESYYISKETEKVTIPEAEALPDKAALV